MLTSVTGSPNKKDSLFTSWDTANSSTARTPPALGRGRALERKPEKIPLCLGGGSDCSQELFLF